MKNKFEVTKKSYKHLLLKTRESRRPWSIDSARYAEDTHSIVLTFAHGCEISIPIHLISEISHSTRDELKKITVSPSGEALVLETADAHIYTKGLIEDVLNPTTTRP